MDPNTSVTEDARRRERKDAGASGENTIPRKPAPRDSKIMEGNVERGPLVDGSGTYDLHDMAAALPPVPHVDLASTLNPALEGVRGNGSTARQMQTQPAASQPQPLHSRDDKTSKARTLARELQQNAQKKSEDVQAAPNFSRGEVKKLPTEKPLPQPPSVAAADHSRFGSVIDAGKTADTTVSAKYAPAVIHETIREDVHEHETHLITREFHQDHIYHRILPIHDVEVLPPVHYVADGEGGVRQVSENEIPGRAHKDIHHRITDSLKKALPKDSSAPGLRQFTARNFENGEGDYKEGRTVDGVMQSEQHWVHPPTLEQGGMKSGQTKPFHFKGSAQPA